jgi:hypothetical protein
MVERTVSTEALLWTAGGRIAAVLAQRLLTDAVEYVETFVQKRIEEHYSVRALQTLAKLDFPTFSDTNVRSQIMRNKYAGSFPEVTWDAVRYVIQSVATAIRVSSQFGVAFKVLRGHQEAAALGLIASVNFILDALNILKPDRFVGGTSLLILLDIGLHADAQTND